MSAKNPAAPAAANPKPKKDKDAKDKGAAVTIIPAFLDPKTGKLLLEMIEDKDEETGKIRKRFKPINLKPKQFPRTREGRQAYCKYQVAKWTWKGENVTTVGADPVAKKERALERLLKKAEAMKAELAQDKASASK